MYNFWRSSTSIKKPEQPAKVTVTIEMMTSVNDWLEGLVKPFLKDVKEEPIKVEEEPIKAVKEEPEPQHEDEFGTGSDQSSSIEEICKSDFIESLQCVQARGIIIKRKTQPVTTGFPESPSINDKPYIHSTRARCLRAESARRKEICRLLYKPPARKSAPVTTGVKPMLPRTHPKHPLNRRRQFSSSQSD